MTDECRDIAVGRALVEVARRACLGDASADHHDDLVGHRHRLGLVVGDVDERLSGPAVQCAYFAAHANAQAGVEIGERFVEQEERGIADERAPQRHALLLPAGKLAGLAIKKLVEAQRRGGLLHLRGDRAPRAARTGHKGSQQRDPAKRRQMPHGQRQGDILRNRQMRIERVGLKDHRDIALVGGLPADVRAGQQHVSRAGTVKAGHDAQSSGFAAAGGSQEGCETARPDRDVHLVENRRRPKPTADIT